MAINSHITDEQACLHGIRALEWILQAAQGDVVKIMIEEGVVETCSDLLKLQQIELIRYVCGCLSKLAKFSSIFGILDFHDIASLLYVLDAFDKDNIFETIKLGYQKNRQNESLILEYSKFLANLCASRINEWIVYML